jgi:hypothetical protein
VQPSHALLNRLENSAHQSFVHLALHKKVGAPYNKTIKLQEAKRPLEAFFKSHLGYFVNSALEKTTA